MASCFDATWSDGRYCHMDKYCPDFEKCVFRNGEESLKAAAQDRNYYDAPGKVTIATPEPIEPQFAIISTDEGFKFAQRENRDNTWRFRYNDGAEGWFLISAPQVVATYQNAVHCKQQLAAAQKLEKQLRPMWQAALEHAKRLEIMMTDAVYAIAKDNEIK